MSENLEVKKYTAIDEDAVIEIKIQGDYYISLKSVFSNFLVENESKESIGLILDNLSNQKITTLKEHRLYLMYSMLVGIEEAAKEQGLLTKKSVDEVMSKDPED